MSDQDSQSRGWTPKSVGKRSSSFLQRSARGVVGFGLFAVIVVAAIFYAFDTSPLFPINTRSTYTPTQPSTSNIQTPQFSEPAFVILGEYNDELYTFNRGVKKVYAYKPSDFTERQISRLVDFESFWWHGSGKVLVLSRAYNSLGNIYLLDLTQSSPESVSITDRESEQRLPRNLSVEASLPLAWAESGDAVAFVARDTQNNTESLFIFEAKGNRLVYTPARNLERISSVIWVEGDKRLALIAVSDGQEIRYYVDRLGGQFSVWDIKD